MRAVRSVGIFTSAKRAAICSAIHRSWFRKASSLTCAAMAPLIRPTNSSRAMFSGGNYELARAKRSKLPAHVDATTMEMCHASGILNGERLACVFAAAMRAKPSKFQVAMFLAHKWLEEMEQKFGKPGDDYLEYRSRVTVSTEDPEGFTRQIHPPFVSPSASELDRSNFLRSIAETEGQELADQLAANDAARKSSTKKRKKAAGSSKSPV